MSLNDKQKQVLINVSDPLWNYREARSKDANIGCTMKALKNKGLVTKLKKGEQQYMDESGLTWIGPCWAPTRRGAATAAFLKTT